METDFAVQSKHNETSIIDPVRISWQNFRSKKLLVRLKLFLTKR